MNNVVCKVWCDPKAARPHVASCMLLVIACNLDNWLQFAQLQHNMNHDKTGNAMEIDTARTVRALSCRSQMQSQGAGFYMWPTWQLGEGKTRPFQQHVLT